MDRPLEKLLEKIKQDGLLCSLLPLFDSRQVFLVGGYIRDAYLGTEPILDYDLVVLNENSKTLADEIAEKTQGTLVELDAENRVYRVVSGDFYLDITCTDDILEDAKRRDFTLNSVYYDFKKCEIYDPLNGLKDLENGVLNAYKLENFDDDPLRMLRAFRFASLYGFEIASEALAYIKENAKSISKSAPERVTYEVIRMFEGENLVPAIKTAHKTGLLAAIFPFVEEIENIPPNSHHHLNLLEHSFETIRHIRINNPLLKLAALMHDIGKPNLWKIEPCETFDPQGNLITERHRFIGHEEEGAKLAKPILESLKFSRKQIDFITKMIQHHIYPSALMHQSEKTEKSMIRFARNINPYTKELIELARADRLSARGVLVTDEVVEKNLKNLEELNSFCEKILPELQALPKLLDGNEIMKILNIKPSKKLGEIINALEEAQLEGLVRNKEEAENFIRCKQPLF